MIGGGAHLHGSASGSESLNGLMDQFRIYDRALSAEEVGMLYHMEKPKLDLNDSNFQDAVNLWFTDELNATMTYGHISDWNVSSVTDMAYAFSGRTEFNEDISRWDTSAVTSMSDIFRGATAFNQDIGDWDTSSVTNMDRVFYLAASFNQPIGDWNTSSVTSMVGIFREAQISISKLETGIPPR